MNFKQFEKIAKIYRPDVIISQHGDYCTNKSKNTLGIVYIKKDGTQSRVYNYAGSYLSILNKIGINAIDKDVIINRQKELEFYKENHNKPSLFWDDDFVPDYSEQIEQLTNLLDEMLNSKKYIRIWEY